VGALADPRVGEYVEKFFCSAYQRVGTFRIVGRAKQGGNVATYFCAPDGRILHAIAGPVNADQFLVEAKWVVETAQKAVKEAKGDGLAFKAIIRKAHAEKLRSDHGLAVEPVTFDPPEEDDMGALSYRDPTGRLLAPKLNPVPIEGPDVKFKAAARELAAGAPDVVLDRRGKGWALNNQGRVHQLLAAHSMGQIERLYASIFEGILGERISTRPVEVVGNPFPPAPKVKRGG